MAYSFKPGHDHTAMLTKTFQTNDVVAPSDVRKYMEAEQIESIVGLQQHLGLSSFRCLESLLEKGFDGNFMQMNVLRYRTLVVHEAGSLGEYELQNTLWNCKSLYVLLVSPSGPPQPL